MNIRALCENCFSEIWENAKSETECRNCSQWVYGMSGVAKTSYAPKNTVKTQKRKTCVHKRLAGL